MSRRWLTALPVYNEARFVKSVLDEVCRHSPDVLVVDDGSTDGGGEVVSCRWGSVSGFSSALQQIIDRERIDSLLKTLNGSDRARLTTLYNAMVSTLKAYNEKSTAARLKDWQAAGVQ